MRVPGSPLDIDHPFSWYAIVKEKDTGKQFTYWMNGTMLTREVVAEHIARSFPGVDVVTIDQCTGPPTRALQPVPPKHFEYGIRNKVEKFLRGDYDRGLRKLGLKPIALKPIPLTPLWR